VPESSPTPTIPRKKKRSLHRRFKRFIRGTPLEAWYYASQLVVFQALRSALGAIPREWIRGLAGALGLGLWFALRQQRHRMRTNFRLVFGAQLSPRRCRAMGAAVLAHYLHVAFDAATFPRRIRRENVKSHFSLAGEEAFEADLARGQGVLVASAHFGNWELVMPHMGLLGYPAVGIVAERTNPLLQHELNRVRTETGAALILREGGVRKALQALRSGKALFITADMRAEREGEVVTFFERPARTFSTLAALSKRLGCPIHGYFAHWVAPLRYEARFERLFDPSAPGEANATVLEVMQRVTRAIETAVIHRPTQWTWSMERWEVNP